MPTTFRPYEPDQMLLMPPALQDWLSEAPNGWIKQVMGFRRFSVRGLRKVQGEWALVCLALNMKRMQGLQPARRKGNPPHCACPYSP